MMNNEPARHPMKPWLRLPILLVSALLIAGCASSPIDKTARIVDSAQSTVEKMKNDRDVRFFMDALKDAQGVAIFPTVIKGGFFFGILVSRHNG